MLWSAERDNRRLQLGRWIVGCALTACFSVGAVSAEELPPPASRKIDFRRDVQPLFKQRCLECHRAEKQEAGLRLDRRAEALAGGDSGVVIKPGQSADSLLIRYVAGIDPDIVMPPDGNLFSKEEISVLRGWIDQGAKWPDEKE